MGAHMARQPIGSHVPPPVLDELDALDDDALDDDALDDDALDDDALDDDALDELGTPPAPPCPAVLALLLELAPPCPSPPPASPKTPSVDVAQPQTSALGSASASAIGNSRFMNEDLRSLPHSRKFERPGR